MMEKFIASAKILYCQLKKVRFFILYAETTKTMYNVVDMLFTFQKC